MDNIVVERKNKSFVILVTLLEVLLLAPNPIGVSMDSINPEGELVMSMILDWKACEYGSVQGVCVGVGFLFSVAGCLLRLVMIAVID